MWKVIIFALSLLIGAIMLLALVIGGIVFGVKKYNGTDVIKTLVFLKRTAIILLVSIIFCGTFTMFTQWTASTPSIRDENGNVVEGSIAELREVEINGRKEWITIRGHDTTKPILLFLAGGPGGTQMAATRYELEELEKYFVVVNWDQPGSGKSYSSVSYEELTIQTYIDDGITLSEYLCEEFEQEKIYVLGESWGSALGIFMAYERPDLYHAFIGTGQMVAFVETEKMDYHLALELAKEAGDTSIVSKLLENGEPPYYGSDVTWKSATYLNYLSSIMAKNPEIKNGGYQTIRDLCANEYGIIDKINFVRGIINSFNHLYPLLYDIDLREDYNTLEIPTYFFLGRHDINAPVSLAEDYYEVLNAPYKEIVWFEHSGHSPWINERDLFVEKVIQIIDK
ncbi:MAG: alpha/beta fold hydrolase [Coprobacillaceae bacterium]